MAKIDRSEQEKTVQIGPWKVKLGNICIIGLVVILVGSSLAFFGGRNRQQEQPQPNKNLIQAQIVIVFNQNNTVEKVASVESGQTAFDILKKVANITTTDTINGKVVNGVSYKNLTAVNTDENQWTLFINGRQNFLGVDRHTISNGDLIVLKYESKVF